MSIKKIIRAGRTNNKCKHCRIASRCLPGDLDKRIIKQSESLNFKARLLEPGEHLYRQGEQLDRLFAIRTGILKSYTNHESGKEFIMGFHLPPDLFGWEAIDDHQLSVSVVAIDHCNVCEIPVNQIKTLSDSIPEFEQKLFQMVSQRIKTNNDVLLRTTAEQRVVHFLLKLTEHYTLIGFPYYLCKLIMTHQDIANYLRIAPETISRIFRRLQDRKLISVAKHNVYLNDIKTLREISVSP